MSVMPRETRQGYYALVWFVGTQPKRPLKRHLTIDGKKTLCGQVVRYLYDAMTIPILETCKHCEQILDKRIAKIESSS
jgi:hypothetical protein